MGREQIVLVTGGSGLVGKALRQIKPSWIYISSADYDLAGLSGCRRMLWQIKPDAIVHLAAKVGGIKDNAEYQADFFSKNMAINMNLLSTAKEFGVKRILSALSTCAFPDVVENYPFDEEDMFSGPPAETNFSYGYTKRCLHVYSKSLRSQYGLDYSTFSPCNVYGPNDHFASDGSHFISALIRKVAAAKDGSAIELWGDGSALRQHIFVEDLAKLIPVLLEQHHSDVPLIVAPQEVYSVDEIAKTMIEISGKRLSIKYSGQLSGQYQKTGSNKKLLQLVGNIEFMPLREGLAKTYQWYCQKNAKNDV